MKILSLLSCLALLLARALSLNELEAARVLYYYTVYDLDVEVFGPGNGHIAPACAGVLLPDGRCTFTEFVNFIDLGAASTNPKYYDTSSSFSFFPGDIAAMIAALQAVKSAEADLVERVVRGRRSAVGIFDDLATIVDRDHVRAEAKNIGITRHLTNLKEAMGGLRAYQAARMEGGLLERMRSYRKDILWKTVERESSYRKLGWNKIDWQATVAANPDLAYAGSTLYKNTVLAIQGFDTLEGNMAEKTIAVKTAQTFKACFG